MLKVVVMNQGLEGAIPWYRLYQPLKYCEKKGLLKAVFYSTKEATTDIMDELDDADVIVWQCPTSLTIFHWLCALENDNKALKIARKSVIEFDDNLIDISPWNEKYNVFGTKETFIQIQPEDKGKYDAINKMVRDGEKKIWQLPDGSWEYKLWEDGFEGFYLKDNVQRIECAKRIVRQCDLFQCTTKELAKYWCKYSQRTKPTAILPNLIDFDRWEPQKPNDTGRIRIGWQGGSSHYRDWKEVLPALIRLQKEYDNIDIVIAGQTWKGLHDNKLKNIIKIPWHGDIRTYPLMMRELKLDIGIIPLEDSTFNRGKSALKWLEYSALKIPTIASNVTPYKEVINQAKTGYLVENNDDSWYRHIKKLIENPELGKEMAEKAHVRVKAKFNVSRSVEWAEAYESLNAYSKPRLEGVDYGEASTKQTEGSIAC